MNKRLDSNTPSQGALVQNRPVCFNIDQFGTVTLDPWVSTLIARSSVIPEFLNRSFLDLKVLVPLKPLHCSTFLYS